MTIVFILVIWCLSFFSAFGGLYFIATTDLQLKRVGAKLDFVSDKLDTLQPQVNNAVIWLNGWPKSCPGWNKLKDVIPPKYLKMNDEYIAVLKKSHFKLYRIQQQFKSVPRTVSMAKNALEKYVLSKAWIWIIFAILPAIAPTLWACYILPIAAMESCMPDPEDEIRLHKSIRRWGLGPLMCSMLGMLVSACVIMVLLNGLGLYCANNQLNTVMAISASSAGYGNLSSNSTTQLVSYYLQGHSVAPAPDDPSKLVRLGATNDVVSTLNMIRNYMKIANDNIFVLRPLLNIAGMICSDLGNAQVARLIVNLVDTVNQLLPETRRDVMFAHYSNVVQSGVCRKGINAIGTWFLCQVLGFLLLPVLTYYLFKYMCEHEQFMKKAQEKKEEEEARLLAVVKEEKLAMLEEAEKGYWFPFLGRGSRIFARS
jgi:hypothetical protein